MVSVEIGCVDDHGLFLAMLGAQTSHDPSEDAFITLSLPSIVECLVKPLFPRGIAPPEAIVIYKDSPDQYAPVINPWRLAGLQEVGRQTRHLRIGQPKNQTYHRSIVGR